MSAFDELVEKVEDQPVVTVPVRILLDPDAAARHQALEQELADMLNKPSGSIDDRGPAQVADDLRELMDGAEYQEFVFATVSPRKWSDLTAKHAPSADERRRGLDVAPSFWPAAMALTCVQPEGATLKGFTALWESANISSGQWERLIGACQQANVGDHDIRPTRAASVAMHGRRQKSESQPISE